MKTNLTKTLYAIYDKVAHEYKFYGVFNSDEQACRSYTLMLAQYGTFTDFDITKLCVLNEDCSKIKTVPHDIVDWKLWRMPTKLDNLNRIGLEDVPSSSDNKGEE